jgi:hypothetical protein
MGSGKKVPINFLDKMCMGYILVVLTYLERNLN